MMAVRHHDTQPVGRDTLPEFAKPPVVEVAMGVQFRTLEAFKSPHSGLLWLVYKDDFPKIEELHPLEPSIEPFGEDRKKPLRLALKIEEPSVPRVLFLNAGGSQLIQIQRDRFLQNWRRRPSEEEYPRYETGLRESFVESFEKFCAFAAREGLGEIVPTQCEVSYFNLVQLEASKVSLPDVLNLVDFDRKGDWLPEPENGSLSLRFPMVVDNKQIGRLHVSAEPGFLATDGKPVLRLNLTARGLPLGEGREGIMRFLDLGREWVVRGFTSITTERMHQLWGRQR